MAYTCRLCERSFHEELYLLDMYSREGKQLNAASKLLSTLAIMVTENDPTSNYVCKVCFEHVEDLSKFVTRCRATNDKIMNKAMLTNHEYKDEMRRVMKIPIQSFYYQKQANDNGVYDAVVKYMRHKKLPKIKSAVDLNQLIIHYSNKHNRVLNSVNVENNLASDNNRTPPQSSSVVCIDMNSTNNKLKSIINNRIQSKTKEPFINGIHKHIAVKSKGHHLIEPVIVKNTRAEHDYDGIYNEVQSSSNKADLEDNDIIWLDDDDDDDVQFIEESVHHLPKTSLNTRIIDNKIINNNITNKEIDKTSHNTLNFKRTLKPLFDQNGPFSSTVEASKSAYYPSKKCPSRITTLPSVPTEEMMVTPDMSHLSNIGTSPNQPNDEFYYNSLQPIQQPLGPIEMNSSLVTPETGFHFLFTSDQTVDLTCTDKSEEKKHYSNKKTKRVNSSNSRNYPPTKKSCKKIPINHQEVSNTTIKQLHTPSTTVTTNKKKCMKIPISYKDTLDTINNQIPTSLTTIKSINVSKSRPKRSTVLASTIGKDKKGLWKLGKHSDTCAWTVDLYPFEKPLIQCPVCNKFFCSEFRRRFHENEHSFPNVSIDSAIDYVSKFEDTISTEQQEFLVYLNLTKRISSESNMMNKLASRTQLLKALKIVGNVKGSYNCHFCKYSTSRMFILWAHMSSFHNEPDADKKSSSFCFVCNRVLSKRSQLLKHLDKCIETYLKNESSSSQQEVEKFTCEFCDADIKSLSHLEQHIWNHVNFQNNHS